jgi:hypothetical protein
MSTKQKTSKSTPRPKKSVKSVRMANKAQSSKAKQPKTSSVATTKAKAQPPKPKKKKTTYKITNWKDYNAALVKRGSLTIWLGDDALASWESHEKPAKGSKGGRPKTYSDTAIETALTLREVYHLSLRATEGFLSSLLTMLGASVSSPDYSSLSYRAKTLKITLSRQAKAALAKGEPVHIAVDSTGVKVYGEGEWKVKKHGWGKHRTWRKVHLGVSTSGPSKHLIPTSEMTSNGTGDGDSQVLPKLLDQLNAELPDVPVGEVSADGAYDTKDSYEAIAGVGAKPIIPPRKGAKIWQHGNSKAERLPRDQAVRRIRKVGRKQWKREAGYHQRSLSETAMFRFKVLFGGSLANRLFSTQTTQVRVRVNALNTMTLLGMPQSVAVPAGGAME